MHKDWTRVAFVTSGQTVTTVSTPLSALHNHPSFVELGRLCPLILAKLMTLIKKQDEIICYKRPESNREPSVC